MVNRHLYLTSAIHNSQEYYSKIEMTHNKPKATLNIFIKSRLKFTNSLKTLKVSLLITQVIK